LIEAGYEPLNIAAAAIKIARGDEKQRPIAEIADVKAEAPRKFEKDYGRGAHSAHGPIKREFGKSRRVSHEEGMIRMKLNKGKANGIRPNDIVGTIAFHANIPGHVIGKIRIEDKITYVDIPEDLVDQVMKHNGNYNVGKDKFSLQKA
jgi:ATP-dependent RNA helicase DeaD